MTTSKSGLAACDVARRVIRDIKTGTVIGDCVPDSEPDDNRRRQIRPGAHYRFEIIMKDAVKWFLQLGPDVSELYSPPRIVQ